MKKSKIHIKVDFIIYINIGKVAKYMANTWYNAIVNIIGNNNNKSNINYTKFDLAKLE